MGLFQSLRTIVGLIVLVGVASVGYSINGLTGAFIAVGILFLVGLVYKARR